MKLFISILCILLIFGCKDKSTYVNENEECELNLYSDSTYKLEYSTFLKDNLETGNYKIQNDSIKLIHKKQNNIENVDIRYFTTEKNPDSLVLKFSNLYEENIQTKFYINDSETEFTTDKNGKIILSYKNLEDQKILKPNSNIKKIRIVYKNKIYSPDMLYYLDSGKPDRLEFKLNQFIGEKYVILKRKYLIKSDTIYSNDLNTKFIGSNKLIKK